MTLREAIMALRESFGGDLTQEQAAKFKALELIAEKLEDLEPDYQDGTPI